MAIRTDYGGADDPVFTGDDIVIRKQMVDAAGAVEGDISTHAYQFDLTKDSDGSQAYSKTTADAEVTIENGDTDLGELDGANSVVKIVMSDTVTDALEPGAYTYRLKRTNADAEGTRAWGTITFRKGIEGS